MARLFAKSLLVVVLLVVVALYGLLATESGTRFAFDLARSQLQGFQYQSVNGHLLGPLQLQGFKYSTETLQLDISAAALDWKPGSLFRGELLLSKLLVSEVSAVRLRVAEQPDPGQPFTLPTELPLPLTVRVQELVIDGIEWRNEASAAPLLINTINAALVANNRALNIQTLSLDAPLFSVDGSFRTNVQNNYDTEARLNWQLRIEKIADIKGTLNTSGDLSGLNNVLRANAKTAQYGEFNASLNATANQQSAQIAQFKLGLIGSELLVTGNADVDFSSTVVDADLAWQHLQWPLPAGIEEPAKEATQKTNQKANQETNIVVSSENGSLKVNGSLQDYSAELEAALSTTKTPDGNVAIEAKGSSQKLNVNSLTLNTLSGSVNGTAALDWSKALRTEFDLQGKHLNPGELSPQWPGALNFTARGHHQAAAENTAQKIALQQLKVNGMLREVPITVNARLSVDGQTANIETLTANAEKSTLQASGVLGERSNFDWRIKSANLAVLHPLAAGAVSSHGTVSGSMASPVLSMTLNASNFSFQQYALEKIDLDAAIDLASDKKSTLQVSVLDAQLPGLVLETLSLQGSGKRQQHELTFSTKTQYGGAQLGVSGSLGDELWSGQLQASEFSPKDFPVWRLSAPATIVASMEQQSIEGACWASKESTVCLQGKSKAPSVSAELSLANFDLAPFKKLLAPELSVRGMLDGELNFSQSAHAQWQLKSRLENSVCSLELLEPGEQSSTELLGLQPGLVQVSGNQAAIDAQINVPFTGGGGINGSVGIRAGHEGEGEGEGKVADEGADEGRDERRDEQRDEDEREGEEAGLAKGSLLGKLNIAIPKLDFLATLSPELSEVHGELKAEIALQGRVDKPEPTGQLHVTGAAFELVTPSVLVHDLNLQVTADSTSRLSYTGAAESDNGNVVLAGSTLLDGEHPETKLSIKGTEFQIWNTADARVWVSPDLKLNTRGPLTKLRGKVFVPRAQITPKELPKSAVRVSRDQIIVKPSEDGQGEASAKQTQSVDAKLSLQFGEHVEISAFGFNSRLSGDLDIRQKPHKPLVASGELNVIDGEYRAYGQGLVIDHGQFLFAGGEIDNPGLSVKAVRRPAKDIVVGVNVRGELQEPDIKIFSEPSMSSSNQLSWLVLGRPMESASGAESDYISQAALVLGVKGGNFLTKGLGERLGVDSIGIETGSGEAGAESDVNQAALVIGKYLTPKLYVSYGVSLLESTSTVKLRYLMTKRWSLVTQSAVDSSAGDVSYTFEK